MLVLDNDNFDIALKLYPKLLVLFYAPWCGHCAALKPIVTIAASILKMEGSDVRIAKIDATNNYIISARYRINGYPIIKFLEQDREPVEYTGGRSKPQEFVDWIKKKTGTSSQLISSKQDLDKAKVNRRLFVVYFGHSSEDKDFATFNQLASSIEKLFFAHIFDPLVKQQADIKPETKVALYKEFDDGVSEYSGTFTVQAITDYINIYGCPYVQVFDDDAREILFGKKRPGIILFTDDKKTKVDLWHKIAIQSRSGIFSQF